MVGESALGDQGDIIIFIECNPPIQSLRIGIDGSAEVTGALWNSDIFPKVVICAHFRNMFICLAFRHLSFPWSTAMIHHHTRLIKLQAISYKHLLPTPEVVIVTYHFAFGE